MTGRVILYICYTVGSSHHAEVDMVSARLDSGQVGKTSRVTSALHTTWVILTMANARVTNEKTVSNFLGRKRFSGYLK